MAKRDHKAEAAAKVAADRKAEAAAVYRSLVEHHRLTAPHHLAMAKQAASALTSGNVDVAHKMIALLPAAVTARVDNTPSPTADDVRKKMGQLFDNAVAAAIQSGELTEDGDDVVDASEVADLRRRIASLEDENLHLRGKRPRRLPAPSKSSMAEISERTGPSPSGPSPSSPTPAPSASSPTPAPSTPRSEPLRPSEPAWRDWYYNGGGGDGLAAAGWIARLNGREW